MVLNLPKNWEYFLKGRDIEKSLLSIKSLLEKEKKLGKEIFNNQKPKKLMQIFNS